MKESKKTWAEEKLEELEAKGKKNWNDDDWDSYNYIHGIYVEIDYYNND